MIAHSSIIIGAARWMALPLAGGEAPPTLFIIFFIGTFLLVVGGLIYAAYFEKKRRESLQKFADRKNFSFHADPGDAFLRELSAFDLFNRGRARRMYNLLAGEVNDAQVLLFDYRYTTGSGKNSTTHTMTMACISSDYLDLPKFSIRPERFLHKLVEIFGLKDIDFDEYPRFSKAFLLSGQDEDAVRRVFNKKIIDYFTDHPGINMDAVADRLIYYETGRRQKPEKFDEFLEHAMEIHNIFAEPNM